MPSGSIPSSASRSSYLLSFFSTPLCGLNPVSAAVIGGSRGGPTTSLVAGRGADVEPLEEPGKEAEAEAGLLAVPGVTPRADLGRPCAVLGLLRT